MFLPHTVISLPVKMSHVQMSITLPIHEAHQNQSRESRENRILREKTCCWTECNLSVNPPLLPFPPLSTEGKVIHQKSHISHPNVSGMRSKIVTQDDAEMQRVQKSTFKRMTPYRPNGEARMRGGCGRGQWLVYQRSLPPSLTNEYMPAGWAPREIQAVGGHSRQGGMTGSGCDSTPSSQSILRGLQPRRAGCSRRHMAESCGCLHGDKLMLRLLFPFPFL